MAERKKRKEGIHLLNQSDLHFWSLKKYFLCWTFSIHAATWKCCFVSFKIPEIKEEFIPLIRENTKVNEYFFNCIFSNHVATENWPFSSFKMAERKKGKKDFIFWMREINIFEAYKECFLFQAFYIHEAAWICRYESFKMFERKEEKEDPVLWRKEIYTFVAYKKYFPFKTFTTHVATLNNSSLPKGTRSHFLKNPFFRMLISCRGHGNDLTSQFLRLYLDTHA